MGRTLQQLQIREIIFAAHLLGWELSRKWAVALPTWGKVPEMRDEASAWSSHWSRLG